MREGSRVAELFAYAPPRFGLRPPEQDLLRLALLDHTDAEIAQELHLSLSAVHKRWRVAHERVAAVAPALCPPHAPDQHGRGGERRRLLLSYLRHHLEELRPCLPPRP